MEDLSRLEYEALAEFRYQIRRFLRFSEEAAVRAGVEPQQHQLLLAVKGNPDPRGPTISFLAERLQLRHHSIVGLLDRLVDRQLAVRTPDDWDKRQVRVRLTAEGEHILRELSIHHQAELRTAGRALVDALGALLKTNETEDSALENVGGN